jgi:hypothetical protein
MTWFGGKAAFRLSIDDAENLVHGSTVIEERIVVLDCANADEALQRLEVLADKYAAEGTWPNSEGQRVRTRRLLAIDVYRISNGLADGTEVYSRTEIVDVTQSDDSLISRFFGKEESDAEDAMRKHFEPDFERAASESETSKNRSKGS